MRANGNTMYTIPKIVNAIFAKGFLLALNNSDIKMITKKGKIRVKKNGFIFSNLIKSTTAKMRVAESVPAIYWGR